MVPGKIPRDAITAHPRQAPKTDEDTPPREVAGGGSLLPGVVGTLVAAGAGAIAGIGLGGPWVPVGLPLLATLVAFPFALSALCYGLLDKKAGPHAGCAVAVFLVLVLVADPFINARGLMPWLVAAFWLVPSTAGGVLFPARGQWFAAAACWVLLFACTTAVIDKARYPRSYGGIISKRYE